MPRAWFSMSRIENGAAEDGTFGDLISPICNARR